MYQKMNEIVDIISDATSGIFYAMYSLGETYVGELDFSNYESLDRIYYLEHSGNKYISPYYDYMLKANKPISEIAKDILIMNKDNWLKIQESLLADYNPIDNYSMEEHESMNSKIKSTSNSKKYGFNTGDEPVGDYDVDNETSGNKEDNYRDLTRSGNIGVTTPQKLISSELELRRNKLFNIIMNDIDKMLCLLCY